MGLSRVVISAGQQNLGSLSQGFDAKSVAEGEDSAADEEKSNPSEGGNKISCFEEVPEAVSDVGPDRGR